jgi:hypothetical protein
MFSPNTRMPFGRFVEIENSSSRNVTFAHPTLTIAQSQNTRPAVDQKKKHSKAIRIGLTRGLAIESYPFVEFSPHLVLMAEITRPHAETGATDSLSRIFTRLVPRKDLRIKESSISPEMCIREETQFSRSNPDRHGRYVKPRPFTAFHG